jgi:hypothetical protein
MKPLSQTYTAGSAGEKDARLIQAAMAGWNPDVNARWTMEAIEWRANYVGPVLEEILHEMQEHGWQDPDAEACALPPMLF